jgi:hypothetical protein
LVQLSLLATLLVPVIDAVPQRRCLSSLIGLGCVCCRHAAEKLPACCARRQASAEPKSCCQRDPSDEARVSKTCICKARSGQPLSLVQAVRPEVRPKNWVATVCEVTPLIAAASHLGTLDHPNDSGQWAASTSLQARLCRWLI